MNKILVTGGCGYIGSHTIVDLMDHGFEVISIDDLSRAFPETLAGVNQITGKSIRNYPVNLCDVAATRQVFTDNPDIKGIIHFAAFKSVPESVDNPLVYYHNNIGSLVNILNCAAEFGVKHVVFSSSCSVYGNADQLPVDEQTPFKTAESPYARTKQMGEDICRDFAAAHKETNIILLRYFNPVGAHSSALIGERNKRPENLVPTVTQTAFGLRESMTVFGTDYATRDGSCIRDYIHVSDIAHAHTLAAQKSISAALTGNIEVFNLGTGNGVSVLELIAAFEKVSGKHLNYLKGPRRPGDVIAIYANNDKARNLLGWQPVAGIEEMMDSAWKWQLQMG